jgi:membrane protein DedA with SNARE-associated domain
VIAPAILEWIGRYGYAAVALGVLLESAGVPVPGETVVLAASFASAHGSLSLGIVIVVAAVSGVLGDNIGFVIGRRFGRALLDRRGRWVFLTRERLTLMDAFFARFGPAAVAIARFVTGVRVIAALAAGVSHMRWRTFLVYNILGAVLWASAVSLAGYALGHGYKRIAGWLGGAGVAIALTALVIVAGVWLVRRLQHRVTPRT